jgi:exopolysaccharide production protein ExoY
MCVLAVRFAGPGPILFRQSRIGKGGVEFTCLKFRTMSTGAEATIAHLLVNSNESQQEWLAVRKLTHDPRVTRIGRFLRRYCLDELPQLFNVLAGEMSIVGPRPIVAEEIGRYGCHFVDYCSVKPGLTGLWQVSGRHALSYEQRVALDAKYARSKSVKFDFLILCRTVPIVIRGENL